MNQLLFGIISIMLQNQIQAKEEGAIVPKMFFVNSHQIWDKSVSRMDVQGQDGVVVTP